MAKEFIPKIAKLRVGSKFVFWLFWLLWDCQFVCVIPYILRDAEWRLLSYDDNDDDDDDDDYNDYDDGDDNN